MLQQALQNLPVRSEVDSKLLIPTEQFENMDTSEADDGNSDSVSVLDRMMCEIVDAL